MIAHNVQYIYLTIILNLKFKPHVTRITVVPTCIINGLNIMIWTWGWVNINPHYFLTFIAFINLLHFFVGHFFTIVFQYCLFSVMSAVSSYLFMSSRLLSIHLRLGRPLILFPGTTMSIIFLEMLSSSLLMTCPHQFNRFCLRNVDIWHTLASSCIIWFPTWSFLVLPSKHPHFCYMQ